MPQYKLIYFPIRARAEISRLIFQAAGVKYDEELITFEDWGKRKNETPGGALPILEVDGVKMTQSVAIARYLAKEFGLDCSNTSNLENALGDEIVETVWTDALPKLFQQHLETDEKKKKELRQALKDTHFPFYAKQLEAKLKKHGKNGFFFGKLTWADLAVYEFVTDFIELNSKCLDDYPCLSANKKAVESNPKLKVYLKNRPKSVV